MTNPDAATKAAERLRRHFHGKESARDVWGEPGTGHLDQRLDDQDAVIAAYLAEHPADDDEAAKLVLDQLRQGDDKDARASDCRRVD